MWSNLHVTVDTIIDRMQEHLRSQRNIVLDRKEFYTRNQQADEPFDDYYIALQEIAAFCEFCTECSDQQFRDRLVTGIRDEETVKQLLTEKQLTLEKTITICRAKENANKDSENLHTAAPEVNNITRDKKPNTYKMEKAKYGMRPWRDKNKQQESKNRYGYPQKENKYKKCKFCGRNWHDQLSHCPARGESCAKCGVKWHFAVACIRSVTVTGRCQ